VQDARAEGGRRQQPQRNLRAVVEQLLSLADYQRVHQQVQLVQQSLLEQPADETVSYSPRGIGTCGNGAA
jgi:hypothetical protein